MVRDRFLELTATRERRAAAEVSVAVVRMRAPGVTKALDGLLPLLLPLSHERNLRARCAAPSSSYPPSASLRAWRRAQARSRWPADALRPHRDDEHLLAEETMQGRAAQVEPHEDRPARKRRLGAVGKEPGAHGLGLEAAERERLQHRGMAERQVMIEEVPVHLEGVADVRLEDEEPAPRTQDAVRLPQRRQHVRLAREMLEHVAREDHVHAGGGTPPEVVRRAAVHVHVWR